MTFSQAQNPLFAELSVYQTLWRDFELDFPAERAAVIEKLDKDILQAQITKWEYLAALAAIGHPTHKNKSRERTAKYMASVSALTKKQWQQCIQPGLSEVLSKFLDQDKKKADDANKEFEKKDKKDKKEKKDKGTKDDKSEKKGK